MKGILLVLSSLLFLGISSTNAKQDKQKLVFNYTIEDDLIPDAELDEEGIKVEPNLYATGSSSCVANIKVEEEKYKKTQSKTTSPLYLKKTRAARRVISFKERWKRRREARRKTCTQVNIDATIETAKLNCSMNIIGQFIDEFKKVKLAENNASNYSVNPNYPLSSVSYKPQQRPENLKKDPVVVECYTDKRKLLQKLISSVPVVTLEEGRLARRLAIITILKNK